LKKKELAQDPAFIDEVSGNRISAVQTKLEEGADVNSVDFTTGNSGLHYACEKGFTDMVKLLLANGANPNQKNRRGQTPLHLCVATRRDRLTEYMIEFGNANFDEKDNIGKSPLDIAGNTPQYQMDLKEWIFQLAKRRKNAPVVEQNKDEPIVVEDIDIYLKGEKKLTIRITSKDTTTRALQIIANNLGLIPIVSELELVEEVMGKDARLTSTQNLMTLKSKWGKNPKYFRFKLAIKRGSSNDIQVKFRDAIYK